MQRALTINLCIILWKIWVFYKIGFLAGFCTSLSGLLGHWSSYTTSCSPTHGTHYQVSSWGIRPPHQNYYNVLSAIKNQLCQQITGYVTATRFFLKIQFLSSRTWILKIPLVSYQLNWSSGSCCPPIIIQNTFFFYLISPRNLWNNLANVIFVLIQHCSYFM